jgi:DivIVA domain-containing protein
MPDQSSAATEHALLQEITRPLETLPDDPVAVVNVEFPVAMRGYDRATVDAYVKQVSRLVAEMQATRSPEAAVRRALERVGEQISGILQRAHDTAEQITAQSRSEAEDRLELARAEAAEIAAAAQQVVKDLDADTDRIWVERHRIVDDARDLASQLLAVAETAAERFPDTASPPAPRSEDESATGSFSEADDATVPYAEDDNATARYAQDDNATARYAQDDSPTEPYAEDANAPVPHAEPVPLAPEELDETVACSSLPASEEEERDQTPSRSEPARGSARSVIPPASPAANRRSS